MGLSFYVMRQCKFYCVHVSVADTDGTLDEDLPLTDDPGDLLYEPETKM